MNQGHAPNDWSFVCWIFADATVKSSRLETKANFKLVERLYDNHALERSFGDLDFWWMYQTIFDILSKLIFELDS